jgi:hypothetical protein
VLGLVAYDRGDYARFATLVRDGLQVSAEYGVPDVVALGLADVAIVAEATGRPDRAARLFGAATALSEAIELPLAPDPADRARLDRHLTAARAALGEDAFRAALAAGRVPTAEAAVAEALAFVDELTEATA